MRILAPDIHFTAVLFGGAAEIKLYQEFTKVSSFIFHNN